MSPPVKEQYEHEIRRLNFLTETHNNVQRAVKELEANKADLELEDLKKFKKLQIRASILRTIIYRKEVKLLNLGQLLHPPSKGQ